MRVTLRVLAGISLFIGTAYLLLYSNVPDLLEGTNPDGSVSETWRSYVVLAGLLIACEVFAFWTFRRRIAFTVFGGFAGSMVVWMWLLQSPFSFSWEHRNALGIGPTTWRTDLVLLGALCLTQGLAFAVRWILRREFTSRLSPRG
jgi:hypothetical protein